MQAYANEKAALKSVSVAVTVAVHAILLRWDVQIPWPHSRASVQIA